jgi:hypothetical protein
VNEQWEIVKEAIAASLPPTAPYTNEETISNLLTSILRGSLECWALYNGQDAVAIATFQVVLDGPTGIKSLMIYSLYSYISISYELWNVLLQRIKRHAREQGCSRIIAYTDVNRIIELVRILGGNTDFRFIWLEV